MLQISYPRMWPPKVGRSTDVIESYVLADDSTVERAYLPVCPDSDQTYSGGRGICVCVCVLYMECTRDWSVRYVGIR